MKGKYKIGIIIAAIAVFFIATTFVGFSQENIDIAGSTSVQPVMEELVDGYKSNNSHANINVQGGGSGMGIRSVSDGIADIGMSSKNLTPEESEGVEIVELGKEGLVICINNDNPISDLSTSELKQIFSGEITNWKELGGNDEEIHVITREDGSGTRNAFESLIMNDSDIKDSAIIQSSTEAVKQTVATDPGAIGYISLAHMSDDVKPLTVNGVEASEQTIKEGTYELQRPFLMIINEDNTSEACLEFIEWIKSPEGQKIIIEDRIVPIQ